MAMVVVILLNILIAQFTSTYEDAVKIARLEYDADRMRIITRLESSKYESYVGLRYGYSNPLAYKWNAASVFL